MCSEDGFGSFLGAIKAWFDGGGNLLDRRNAYQEALLNIMNRFANNDFRGGGYGICPCGWGECATGIVRTNVYSYVEYDEANANGNKFFIVSGSGRDKCTG
jgi:hypothetical protein